MTGDLDFLGESSGRAYCFNCEEDIEIPPYFGARGGVCCPKCTAVIFRYVKNDPALFEKFQRETPGVFDRREYHIKRVSAEDANQVRDTTAPADLSARIERARQGIPLTGEDLRGKDLRAFDWGQVIAEECDFAAADLRDVSLSGARLTGCNLEEVKLSGATITGAVVRNCSLKHAVAHNMTAQRASMERCSLIGADLSETDFTLTKFYECDFHAADVNTCLFIGSTFRGGRLTNTKLHYARLDKAKLSQVDLTGANVWGVSTDNWMLEDIVVHHLVRAEVGSRIPDVLEMTKRAFKPGEFMGLFGRYNSFEKIWDLKKFGVFLCHSSKDGKFVERVARGLRDAGIKVWLDRWVMEPGDSLREKIEEGIENSNLFAVVLSENSVSSEWVKKELNAGFAVEIAKRDVFVVPILLEPCDIPLFLRDKLYVDFTTSYQQGLRQLVKRIRGW